MIPDHPARVGLLLVELHFPAAQSLKDKRMVLRSVKDRVRHEFNVSVAELDGQDLWQRALVGICTVGNDAQVLNSILDQALDLIDQASGCEVIQHEIDFL